MWADRPQILSRPIRIRWAGWETDTLALQQAGWSLSAHEDPRRMQMQIAIEHHELDVRGITSGIDYDYLHAFDHRGQMFEVPAVQARLANRLYLRTQTDYSLSFHAIDAMPQLGPVLDQMKSLEEVAHFAVPLARTQEIIIPEPNVMDLLDKILAMQEPAKHAYFERQVRNDRQMREGPQQRQKFHAQIVSFAA